MFTPIYEQKILELHDMYSKITPILFQDVLDDCTMNILKNSLYDSCRFMETKTDLFTYVFKNNLFVSTLHNATVKIFSNAILLNTVNLLTETTTVLEITQATDILINSTRNVSYHLRPLTTLETEFVEKFVISETEILPPFDIEQITERTFTLNWTEHHETLFHNLSLHFSKNFDKKLVFTHYTSTAISVGTIVFTIFILSCCLCTLWKCGCLSCITKTVKQKLDNRIAKQGTSLSHLEKPDMAMKFYRIKSDCADPTSPELNDFEECSLLNYTSQLGTLSQVYALNFPYIIYYSKRHYFDLHYSLQFTTEMYEKTINTFETVFSKSDTSILNENQSKWKIYTGKYKCFLACMFKTVHMNKNIHFILYHETFNIAINMTSRQIDHNCKLPDADTLQEFIGKLKTFVPERLWWDEENVRWACGKAFVEDGVWVHYSKKQTEFGLPDPTTLNALDKKDYCQPPTRRTQRFPVD